MDKHWIGVDADPWETGSNWNPAGAPGASDKAIFDSTFNLPANPVDLTSIGALEMALTGVTLTVRNVSVAGDITITQGVRLRTRAD